MQKPSLEIFTPTLDQSANLPLYTTNVPAGFPSPQEDNIEAHLDLNQYLIKHPTATFFVKVQGQSMINAQINNGDILVVDRACEPKNGSIVVAILDGEFTLKRFSVKKGKVFLMAENPEYQPIEVKEENEFSVWGVVIYVIHAL